MVNCGAQNILNQLACKLRATDQGRGAVEMLELAWAELADVTRRIEYLQSQRLENMRAKVGRPQSIESEFDRTISERDRVVSRIASLMKAGALNEQRGAYRRAA
jgi:hypothetical protein